MRKILSYVHPFSLLFMLSGSALGWWIIHELIHPETALFFLYVALSVSGGVIYLQGVLAAKGGTRLVVGLLLDCVFHITGALAALCVFMPLMFFHNLTISTKLLCALAVLLFLLFNIHVSLQSAKVLWRRYGSGVFINHLNIDDSSVDWEKVARAMSAHRNVAPVGAPRRWHSIISKIIYAFAVTGLYLAGLYSVFAVVSWAVPAIIVAGVMLQYASHSFFQAHSVWAWQRSSGTILKSAPFRSRKKRKSR